MRSLRKASAMSSPSRYERRGVSADKSEVHAAIAGLDKGLYPRAFCKVLPDLVGGDTAFVNLMHADTAGTKVVLAYLYWRETGDLSVWRGVVQDALVMNLDDLAAVGCTNDFVLSSTIGRNKHLIPGEVLKVLIEAQAAFAERLAPYGIRLHFSGGETADVGDVVRTLDVGFTAFARWPKERLVVNAIRPGDVIVGWASFGQCVYEEQYNSGIGSNGLTSARHDLLSKYYFGAYPESFDPAMPEDLVYTGPYRLTDAVGAEGAEHSIGKLLLSPTRTYLPPLKELLDALPLEQVHGIIHCTGGGQKKVAKFIEGVRVIKDNLFVPPPVFRLIKEHSGTSVEEMYEVFNMGHRLELYLSEQAVDKALAVAERFGIEAKVIGRVEEAKKAEVCIVPPPFSPADKRD